MKHILITTIAAVLLLGCGCKPAWLSIFNAADQGNIEAVKKHLADGVDVNKKEKKKGYTPLHMAAFRGHKEVVELLIAKGAEVNAKCYEFAATPLDLATIQDHVEIKKLLVKHGGKTKKELVGHK
ncbi:ankyrin repeat domain-containing protein [bacterium]|nr:ankyrin repeat domain-containing protein [bacterium]